MTKGYWLSTESIKDVEGMQPYLKGIHAQLPSVNTEFLPAIWQILKKESNFGHLTEILEFPSKEDAVAAYESDEYQR